jgi:hypothetical protein
VRRLQPDSVRISAVCVACPHPAHNNVSVSLVTATRPPVRIALAVNPAAAAPRGVCVPSACVPALHSDAVSPVTNRQRHRWCCPPNMLRTAMLCPPQITRPKWCVPGVCPQWCVPVANHQRHQRCCPPLMCCGPGCCVPRKSPDPSGVSPVRVPPAPKRCVPNGVVVLLVQSLRPKRAGTGLSAVRIPECHPGGVSPAVCPRWCVPGGVSPVVCPRWRGARWRVPGGVPRWRSPHSDAVYPSPTTNVISGAAPPLCCGPRCCVPGKSPDPRGVSPVRVPSGVSPVVCPQWCVPSGVSPVVCPQWCVPCGVPRPSGVSPAACPVPVACPRCVSPRRPGGVSPVARWCCWCNRYGRSVRGSDSVSRGLQSAVPAECPQPDGPPAACPIPVCVPE